MNLSGLHTTGKAVSAKPLSDKLESKAVSIQMREGGLLKEHCTKTPALLLCVLGSVEYGDENGNTVRLLPGDIHPIEPLVKHWVKALQDSQLLLHK